MTGNRIPQSLPLSIDRCEAPRARPRPSLLEIAADTSHFMKPLLGKNFSEITKTALQTALAHPRAINQDLVDAQQARRILDRLVSYSLSPIL